jgi:hypothetical protein
LDWRIEPVNLWFDLIQVVMSSLLYLIALVLIIGWILGVFVYSIGGLIHILLVLAIISILLRLIRGG